MSIRHRIGFVRIAAAVASSFLLGLALASAARAEGGRGAKVLPEGRWALQADVGLDFPETMGYSLGLYHTPVDRLQLGARLTFGLITGSFGASAKLNMLRAFDDRLLGSIEGSFRGFYTSFGLDDFSASFVLEPRMALEWRFGEEIVGEEELVAGRRWGAFFELGTQHFTGYRSDRLYDVGNNSDRGWGWALRSAVGMNFRINESWSLAARVGARGSHREPQPFGTAGVSWSF